MQPAAGVRRVVPADPVLRERDERLESLKSVIGKLAHDFNNFLVPLLGYVGLIQEEVSGQATASQYAGTLETSARKIEGYLEAILLGMRPQRQFNPQDIDLAILLQKNLEDFKQTLPAASHIEIQQRIAPAPFHGDDRHWHKAVAALLSNARYALATGGRLEVELTHEILSAAQQSELGVQAGTILKLVVRDYGFGMSQEVARRAFEPFYTTRGLTKAAGLGLTTVHSVVHLQGGQVTLQSKEDEGTTVTLYIPTQPILAHLERRSTAKPSLGKPGSRILLVHEDPLVREVLRSCLQKTGLETFVAADGQEGSRVFNRHKKDWALVVSGLHLPLVDGIQFFKQVRADLPEIPFIFLTADSSVSEDELFSPANERLPLLLRKPFTLKSFNDVVRKVLP